MNILNLFGGLAGLFRMLLNQLEANPQVDATADRLVTLPGNDIRGIYRGCTLEDMNEGVVLWREAGDKLGDAIAHAARARAKTILPEE